MLKLEITVCTVHNSKAWGFLRLVSICSGVSKLTSIDVDHFGPEAGVFNPERWLQSLDPPVEKELSGLAHLSFGTGSRACSGQYIASRLLYSALIRILSAYKIVASESDPPNTDYVEYNQFKSALVAIPRHFKVKLIPRDTTMTTECLAAAEERTREHYKES